jgi:hypothetical protein
MAIEIKKLDVRRFDAAKMQKINLFETPRFFCDVYCLEPARPRSPTSTTTPTRSTPCSTAGAARVGEESVEVGPGEAVLAPRGSIMGSRIHPERAPPCWCSWPRGPRN